MSPIHVDACFIYPQSSILQATQNFRWNVLNGYANALLQFLGVCRPSFINVPFYVSPQKKSRNEKSGLLGGHGTGPSLSSRRSSSAGPRRPIHLLPNNSVTASLESRYQWGGAPSCWSHISRRNLKGTCSISTGRSFRMNEA